MNKNNQKEAAVMIIEKDGLILSISRKNDSTKFGLVGGKVSNDEDPKTAAIRETFEETEVKVNDCILIYETGDAKNFYTYCFYATSWEGEPKKCEEGEVKWLTVKDLTHSSSAFPVYNIGAFMELKHKFPHLKLK